MAGTKVRLPDREPNDFPTVSEGPRIRQEHERASAGIAVVAGLGLSAHHGQGVPATAALAAEGLSPSGAAHPRPESLLPQFLDTTDLTWIMHTLIPFNGLVVATSLTECSPVRQGDHPASGQPLAATLVYQPADGDSKCYRSKIIILRKTFL